MEQPAVNDIPFPEPTERIFHEFETRAQRLASEGRSGIRPTPDPNDRKAVIEAMIRWAFWKLDPKNQSSFERRQSDEGRLASVIESLAGLVRADEQKRLGTAITRGLTTMFGDDARGLVYEVADAMDLFDQ